MGRIAILALAIALAGPARAEVAPGPALSTLRVGVPAEPDAVAGFDRSLFAEAAREAGLGVVFEVVPPGAALVELDADLLDVAAGPYPPGAALRHLALAPVAGDGDALLKRRGDGSLKTPEDAAGKRVGTLSALPWAGPRNLARSRQGAEQDCLGSPTPSCSGPPAGAARLRAGAVALHARFVPPRPAFPDPLADLAAGRLAALIGALPEVAAAAAGRPDAYEVVGPALGGTVRLAPLVRPDRPGLAARLDAALERMRADGRLADVQRRWFGLAFGPPSGLPPGQPVSTSNR